MVSLSPGSCIVICLICEAFGMVFQARNIHSEGRVMMVVRGRYSYHSLLGECLDLLDRTGSTLLEGDTMQLFN